ncbi:MAG: 50S ribosome-binding GTPase, partial [Synergistaceae bacterium]|nr:50S ribosome-binding GTPase [Synergistaceae bacterium]
RDIINENILINGLPVRISDTAGLRETENVIEAMGVELAKNSIYESDICLYVLDGSTNNVVTPSQGEMSTQLTERLKNTTIIVLNKSDLEQKIDINSLPHDIPKISVSAKNLTGISELKNLIYNMAVKNSKLSSGLNVSAQQLDDLTESLNLIIEAKNSISDDVRADMLNSARINLLKILGIDAGDELLDNMFSRFCVGK